MAKCVYFIIFSSDVLEAGQHSNGKYHIKSIVRIDMTDLCFIVVL